MIYHLLDDPKFWILICFIVFVILMIIPFKKFMIGGLDNKIEEIKKNINLSLEGFTTAEKKLNEASKSTKDIDFKIKEILENAKVESKEISRVIIEKNQSIINSKEKNSIDRIKQIELAAVQSIKSQASIKLNEIIINYFEKMPEEKRKIILKNKIEELKII
jgi:F0F1-type ATP synthase membrane subunit b/b'|tara:strand:- start:83 stop:568 length:486 start_codon:yes stop_codon:yes gene_type:complete